MSIKLPVRIVSTDPDDGFFGHEPEALVDATGETVDLKAAARALNAAP